MFRRVQTLNKTNHLMVFGARGTGMEALIINGKTGALFDLNDSADLAKKIIYLFSLTQKEQDVLTTAAFYHVKNNFCSNNRLALLKNF